MDDGQTDGRTDIFLGHGLKWLSTCNQENGCYDFYQCTLGNKL